MVVYNLNPDKRKPPQTFILKLDQLPGIRQAIVEIKGWHTRHLTEATIKRNPRILNFVQPEALIAATEVFQDANFRRILVVSSLSSVQSNRAAAIELLRNAGVNHVIEFETIVRYITDQVKPNKNYPDSEIMQTIRLLKVYGITD